MGGSSGGTIAADVRSTVRPSYGRVGGREGGASRGEQRMLVLVGGGSALRATLRTASDANAGLAHAVPEASGTGAAGQLNSPVSSAISVLQAVLWAWPQRQAAWHEAGCPPRCAVAPRRGPPQWSPLSPYAQI